MDNYDDDSDDTYLEEPRHGRKRRRLNTKVKTKLPSTPLSSLFTPLFDLLDPREDADEDNGSFEDIIEPLLPEYTRVLEKLIEQQVTVDVSGRAVRPLKRSEVSLLIAEIDSREHSSRTIASAIVERKLKLQPGILRRRLLDQPIIRIPDRPLTPMLAPRPTAKPNPEVIDALYAIKTTPYEQSFLSRLHGFSPRKQTCIIAVDWEARTPWMELMSDIREHHALAHPEREQAVETIAPIEYVSLQAHHLDQIHDLLSRVFWEGVNVEDALQFSPEQSTVIATYKSMVVGIAMLSSPQETYITYLAVKAGWDNARIATSMLFHLIKLNPKKDIILHVSINNPAMLLYNRFGFKAEEFIVGFYEDYLDPHSRASKNAFRLRLRQ